MKKILMVTVLTNFLNIFMLQAQVTDNFSDSNFVSNPAWTGSVSQFAVINGMLQLNSSGTDSSYLVTGYNYTPETYEWDFLFKESFSPSSSNYGRIYLSTDQSDLQVPLHGYFLQFGESGSNDAIELFRQDQMAIVSLGRGTSGKIANGFTTRIKVKRDVTGNWIVTCDYNGGSNYSTEIIANDFTYLPGFQFGIKCNYTSSNATKFYLDDVYVGKEILDTIPPDLIDIKIIDSLHLDLHFSEQTDSLSTNQRSHYLIDHGIGNPDIVSADSIDPTIVHLEFINAFNIGIDYLLSINSIADLSGNILLSDSIHFTFITTSQVENGDIIFTEIMADPGAAPDLPDAEYVEIYNRSNKYLSTKGWLISDGTTTVTMADDTLLSGNYYAFCSLSNLSLFQQKGIPNMIGLSSLPSLNNDGDHLSLKDQNGNALDQLNYDLNYYHDKLKSAGGWSIERIDKNFLCVDINNWKASSDSRGGSPGAENSNETIYSDLTAPFLVHVTLIDSLNILLHFSEPVDTVLAKNINNFNIDNGIGYPQTAFAENYDASIVQLQLSKSLEKNKVYTININTDLKDCAGNNVSKYLSAGFGIADSVSADDLVINEVLFNPKPDASDYVELYNRSSKIIDLHTLKIANADPLTGLINDMYPVSTESRLLLPGNYCVLTEDLSVLNNYFVKDERTIQTTSLPSYNDDEGVVVLLNTALKEIDRFHYTEKMHFPLLTDVEGISLERISPENPPSEISNWHSASSSSGFGTPGYQNSQYFEEIEGSSLLNIDPEIFSPDNDGIKDVITFNLTTDKPGYYASIRIYNSLCTEIKTLTENELLGNHSSWNWDGMDNNNALARTGIYILYLEMIHPDGEVIHKKKVFVLGHKI